MWLALFFPYGLYVMWRRATWRPRAKVVITAGFVVFIIIGAAAAPKTPTGSPKVASEPEMSLAEFASSSPSPTPIFSASPSHVPLTTRATLATSTSNACRTDPLANVYHPSRLEVIEPCISVKGTVATVRHEDDGDYHINVKLDSAYASLVNAGNVEYQGGNLVVEIVPADEAGCIVGEPPRPATGTYDYGVCTGANLFVPAVGARITVTGPYVIDHFHDWAEIHPAWAISTIGSSQSTGTASTPSAVRITSVSPNPVNPGQYITLTARTEPRASCSLTVTYASGHVSTASGLDPKNADGSGAISWEWKVGTRTGACTAHALVSCGSQSASVPFTVT